MAAVPLRLRPIGVQRRGRKPRRLQTTRELLRADLRSREDENGAAGPFENLISHSTFSPDEETCCTVCVIVTAGAPAAPTCKALASLVISRACAIISAGMVAEKSSVCRLSAGGSAATMRRTSGQKPMSIIRSASSRTRISIPSKLKPFTPPVRMWSISRPGVATTMSTPASSARD